MLAEVNQAKRFLGIKFGYGNHTRNGIYAVPTSTSKGKAFFRLEIENNEFVGKDNFSLFWDEALTLDWFTNEKPTDWKESKFSKLFRQIEKEV